MSYPAEVRAAAYRYARERSNRQGDANYNRARDAFLAGWKFAQTTSRPVYTVKPAMQEDGLHGVDGFVVVCDGETVDDSFSQDEGDALELARQLNEEQT